MRLEHQLETLVGGAAAPLAALLLCGLALAPALWHLHAWLAANLLAPAASTATASG